MNSTWLFYKLPKDVAGRTDLPASAKIVLAVLIDRIGQNDCCWPGIRCLAKDTGLTKPAVGRALRCLEARELVHIQRRNKGQSNLYRVPQWAQIVTTGGHESLPEVGTKCGHNKKDQLNQTHRERAQNYDRTGYSERLQSCNWTYDQSRDRQGAARRSGVAYRRNLADVPRSAYGIEIEA